MSEKRRPQIFELEARHIDQVEWQPTESLGDRVKTLSSKDGVSFLLFDVAAGETPVRYQEDVHQVRYVMSGEFIVNGKSYGPETMIELPPNTAFEVSCPRGGQWVAMRYQASAKEEPVRADTVAPPATESA